MNRGYIILTHEATAKQQDAIAACLTPLQLWHWMPQAWVVSDPQGMADAQRLIDLIANVCPSLVFYVFEFTPSANYGGMGPTHWNEWFIKNWGARSVAKDDSARAPRIG